MKPSRNWESVYMYMLVGWTVAHGLLAVEAVIQHSSTSNSATGEPNGTGGTGPRSPHVAQPPSQQHVRWAKAAFSFLHNLDCRHVFFTTERECRHLRQLSESDVNVYVAGPKTSGRLATVLPDGGLGRAGVHDGVVAIDPYPGANLGHLVLVFHVTMFVQQAACERERGIFTDNSNCLVLALKRRCKNALERRWRRRNFARRCEINFIPLVYLEKESNPKRQLLTCRDNIAGFAPCPKLRPYNETSVLICNPLRDNTKRCETSHERVHTSCRVFEICDQAVLLSGGWNRMGTLPRHKENIKDMYHLLREHGFKRRNIKIFFANGMEGGMQVAGESPHEVYPAALKLAMRYHLQKMCASPHCVDSLLLYLNGPARSDGTVLLWDLDGDGVADEKERYTLEEMLSDLADCQARQVNIIVDQSFSGEVARSIKRSHRHGNVVAYTSGKDHEYSWGSEFTKHWTSTNHTHRCAQHVFKEVKRKMAFSNPEMAEGEDVSNMTIFGAPCDVIPPFTQRELQQNYLGCQNLPTALWVIKFLSATQHAAVPKEGHPTAEAETRRSGSRGS